MFRDCPLGLDDDEDEGTDEDRATVLAVVSRCKDEEDGEASS